MFQFTSTIILNSDVDNLSRKPRWTSETKNGVKSFSVKRANNFIADNVKAVYKREAAQPKFAQAKLKVEQWGAGVYQLVVQLNYMGSQNSFYARPTSYIKGKPLFYSFELNGSETPTQIAEKIAKIVNHLEVRFGDKWLNVTSAADVVTVDGIDEYQRFMKVAIQQYQPLDNPCACASHCECGWEDVLEALPADASGSFPNPDSTIVQGREGFGTYIHLMKDLRLPTAANTNWLAVNQEERPIPGALYNQYTIEYVKLRGVQGTDAVGDLVTSSTLHVFYVLSTLAADFEAKMTDAGLTIQTQDLPTGYPA